jgi:molybdopterin molybdotransferase
MDNRRLIRKPVAIGEALERLMALVPAPGTETVALADSFGCVLAEPVVARHDVPPFHRAPYDGYAIRSADSATACEQRRVSFRVVGRIGAGDVPARELGPGEAVRIMTGAPLPPGADAVVMLEQTVEDGQRFTVRKPFRAWENVSLRGEDARAGEVLIEQGSLIHPGVVALLATFGYTDVRVARRPVVGLISTGTELLGADEPLAPGKIRDSNGPMLAAQLARLGIPSRSYGFVRDDPDQAAGLVRRALRETDCVITTGGVSVGDFDYMPAIYERLGARVLFNKVAMRPGSVTTAAVWDGKFLFGLSGNPSAGYVGFEIFVRPVLLRMMGSRRPFLPYTQAVLMEDCPKPNPFTRFVRAVWRHDGQHPVVAPAGLDKSNAVSSIARGNALIVLPGGTRGFLKGAIVDVLLPGAEEGEAEWRIRES